MLSCAARVMRTTKCSTIAGMNQSGPYAVDMRVTEE
jgi:hypothetical protein